ncbi:DUF3080 family protein [Marinobacter mobilis]|uniref:DUF3080 domain-containing protein n=1 Tax=Marinobacter mobilis TaxID=488533 RepID=A0A1H2U7L4_9GAMM|nr:DUF3080 family protein [Marinobacter mobilis]SDW51868.1 Protein of unknown function [Marinobacter mobilis]
MGAFRLPGICVLVVGLTILTSGCNPFSEPRSMLDEYVERLARVLELEPSLSPIDPGERIPRRRDRQLALPELDINMLDFLSLYGCELQYVVGERNSVMGRVMQPLNRLRYEQRFIVEARNCLPEIHTDDALYQQVGQAIESKIASLPIAFWNATWGTEEMESLATLAKGALPITPDRGRVIQVAADLALLNTTLEVMLVGNYHQPLDDVAALQQRWLNTHTLGQLFVSAHLLTARLDDATRLMQQRLEGRPLCLQGKPGQQARLAEAVLFNVYSTNVQPYLTLVQRTRDDMVPVAATLVQRQLAVMPAEFEPWYRRYLTVTDPGSVWYQLDQAMDRHTRSWQALMKQCGLMPG